MQLDILVANKNNFFFKTKQILDLLFYKTFLKQKITVNILCSYV